MLLITQLLLLATASLPTRAEQQSCAVGGSTPNAHTSSLLQQANRRASLQAHLVEDPDEPPSGDSPGGTTQPPPRPETLKEKEAALAALAEVEGNAAVKAEAQQVLHELADGKEVKEEELLNLEATVAAHQSAESLEANGAQLTIDDFTQMHGENVEEKGANGAFPTIGGDLLPSDAEQLAMLQGKANGTVNGTTRRWAGKLWTNARMPYCFAPDVAKGVKDCFRSAVHAIHRNLPCLRFVEVGHVKGTSTTKERWELGFDPAEEAECAETPAVFVQSNPAYGCFSALGMQSWKSQALQLVAPGCLHHGICVHEVLHALGVQHEHQRSDRDAWINVFRENVEDKYVQWFDKDLDVSTHIKFAPDSIMHYGAHGFSKNGLPTITDKSGGTENIGGRVAMTEEDVEQLELMYKEEDPQCKRRIRTGLGCEDRAGGNCDGECGVQARLNCCACGGGMQDQCFEDEPCQPYTLRTGPAHPYPGWIAGGGNIIKADNGWWWGTIENGLAMCAELFKDLCMGVTTPYSPPGPIWMMVKSHFNMDTSDGADSTGWTSYRVAPPAPTPPPTPAPTPAPTPPPTEKMVARANHYITAAPGKVDHKNADYYHVSITKAKAECLAEPTCKGITWRGSPRPGEDEDSKAWLLYKGHKKLGKSSDWNAYIKTSR